MEDDPDVAQSVAICLELRWAGIVATIVDTGLKAVDVTQNDPHDVIILDIGLPDIDGFEVLKRIRRFSNVPVIIITARQGDEDQVKGLEMGADDYIVKPFRPGNLIARINAVLRRSQVPKDNGSR